MRLSLSLFRSFGWNVLDGSVAVELCAGNDFTFLILFHVKRKESLTSEDVSFWTKRKIERLFIQLQSF